MNQDKPLQIDPNTQVRFEYRPVVNEAETVRQGKEVVDQVEYVVFLIPQAGASTQPTETSARATDAHRRQFAAQYQAFKSGAPPVLDGTALIEWPLIGKPMIDGFARYGVRTVEGVAAANEDIIKAVGPGSRELKAKARGWLDMADGTGRASAELALLRGQVDEFRRQNEQLRTANAALQLAADKKLDDPDPDADS